ncbi:MAG: helix-turn-helix transcriptional regulator [Streptosporangiaceae bacterium]
MDVAAVDAERGVVAADCFVAWVVEQAEDGAFGVVVELDLLDAELVGPPVADVAGDLGDRLGGQLARRLGLSEGTVRTHLENIFSRLQVTSRTAAVLHAFPDQVA